MNLLPTTIQLQAGVLQSLSLRCCYCIHKHHKYPHSVLIPTVMPPRKTAATKAAAKASAAAAAEEANGSAGASSSSLVTDLSSRFPLTIPVPTPLTHPDLISNADLATEEDLLHNPDNLRGWLSYVHQIKDRLEKSLPERPTGSSSSTIVLSPEEELLGPLATHQARQGLQHLVCIYERALAIFPTSFKLWKSYFQTRQSFILGPLSVEAKKARTEQGKRGSNYKTNVKELLDGAEESHVWENKAGLDGVVGFEEWKALIGVGERMITWLNHLPVPWLMHLGVLLHPKCPGVFKRTYARRTFDRALRTLPPSLHGRIWGLYLRWAEVTGGDAGERVWRRYLRVSSLPRAQTSE